MNFKVVQKEISANIIGQIKKNSTSKMIKFEISTKHNETNDFLKIQDLSKHRYKND